MTDYVIWVKRRRRDIGLGVGILSSIARNLAVSSALRRTGTQLINLDHVNLTI